MIHLAITEAENKGKNLQRAFQKKWQFHSEKLVSKDRMFDSSVKVYVLWDQPGSMFPVATRDQDLHAAQERVISAFKENGNEVEVVQLEQMKIAFELWGNRMQEAQKDKLVAHLLSHGREEISTLVELIRHLFSFGRHSDFTLPLLGLAMVDKINKRYKPQRWVKQEERKFQELKQQLDQLLTDQHAILVSPSLPEVAHKHGPFPHIFYFANVAATCIYNVLELPVTQVPTGLGSKSLPTGVQL